MADDRREEGVAGPVEPLLLVTGLDGVCLVDSAAFATFFEG